MQYISKALTFVNDNYNYTMWRQIRADENEYMLQYSHSRTMKTRNT